MKILRKNIYWFVCTAVLAIFFLYGLLTTTTHLQFCISSDGRTEKITIYDASDGNSYVFLPSYADLSQVSVVMSPNRQISLGGIPLSNGMACGQFNVETAYPLEINGRHKATLWFYCSANVATMYIDTLSGKMKHIHGDKDYEENASITLYTADGEINYLSEDNTITGRGNGTWVFDKRPYSLKLSSTADLLDMGSAENWVLLANATDETNLNNFLVLDLASQVGFPWTPECRYVDIYLNGEYSGLYLLAEKVEPGDERLNIDTISGDYLCKVDLEERWNTLRNPFLTNAGRTLELCYPKVLNQEDQTKVLSQVNQMEDALLSGSDLSAEEIIDLDSWILRYLIDEISGNIDSDLASSYFYYSSGVFYAGPIWDYDMSFGNTVRNQEPNSFIAKNARKSEIFSSLYYSMLYENDSFYNRMVEIYETTFLPLLQKMLDHDIQNLASRIINASQMNSLRWRAMFDAIKSRLPNAVHNTAELIEYLNGRVSFLSRAWIDNIDYCTIQFEITPYEAYWNISVPKGSLLETSYVDLDSTIWINASTQEIFDFSQPILEDAILLLQDRDTLAPTVPPATQDYITILSIFILLLLFGWIISIDVLNRKKERDTTHERYSTQISS